MTVLDIIVLIMLVLGAVRGFMDGFVQSALTLLAWAAAMLAISIFHAPVFALLTDQIGSTGGTALLTTIIIFVVTFVAVRLLAHTIGGSVRNSILGPLDRVLGFGFGAIKALLIAAVAFLLFTLVFALTSGEDEYPEWLQNAMTYPLLNACAEALVDYVDLEVREGEDGQ